MSNQQQVNGENVPEGWEHVFETQNGHGTGPRIVSMSEDLEVICGPLLNYQRMSEEGSTVYWHGSILIVTKPGQKLPQLELEAAGPQREDVHGNGFGQAGEPRKKLIDGLKLYSDPDRTFWRFSLQLPLADVEMRWRYTVARMKMLSEASEEPGRTFVVPSANESMRIMFHSCNGFSVGTDEDFWSGPALWNDVLRSHAKRPFHVMIGGGDQIYNDSVRVKGPLKEWTDIGNPKKRHEFPFGDEMRGRCDQYYYDNYVRWYSTEPFAAANAQIPQINIWDDHDIIDGFGSYTDHFMRCPVFRGIGGVAFKYYCLFQHHTAPPVSTFTTDAPETMSASEGGTSGADPRQLENTYIYKRMADDPSWIVGKRPGPYVEERSRSLYMRLGRRIAFCGVDARTERTRKQVNYPDTYNLIFDRLERELSAARGQIRHLILLLGVPIAYPRLAWLENILTSPLIAPIRLLNKRFGLGGGLFNRFDGQVDLLDDLDDHYTAKHHKTERRELIVRLQNLAQKHSVRVTILGGDVHLGAVGRFYSNPHHTEPVLNDPRYMANVISSAITNKPPPKAVANLLARRNKIHHLRDGNTDETLLKMFDKQPGGVSKSAEWNDVTMPSRNYATITEIAEEGESSPGSGGVGHGARTKMTTNGDGLPGAPTSNGNVNHADIQNQHHHHQFQNTRTHINHRVGHMTSDPHTGAGSVDPPHPSMPDTGHEGKTRPSFLGGSKGRDGHSPLHEGEEGAGSKHVAADGISSDDGGKAALRGGLNVSLRVEIDNTKPDGMTHGYGFSVPKLVVVA